MRHCFLAAVIAGVLFLISPVFGQNGSGPEWITRFEQSDYLETARYDETIAYFRKLEKASPFAKLMTIGKSPQGREMYCFVVSKDRTFTHSAARKTLKPVFMVNNGIHAGEIEGKDACMLLLREILITKEKAHYLDNLTLLVIPVFSVDGHERFAAYNRINQNGPAEMGWRTTAQNLNLNRDWLKADTPEMQALLKCIREWMPDFFIDTHTTDGADFQYSAMYGIEKFQNMYSGTAGFINDTYIPYLEKRTNELGFLIAPYVGFRDGDVHKGIVDWPGTPRFSTGYFAAQNRIALLIETHMMKPYKERVFATKAMIEATMEFTGSNGKTIMRLNQEADERSAAMYSAGKTFFPILMRNTYQSPSKFFFRGIKHTKDSSIISGAEKVTFTGEPFNDTVPFLNSIIVVDSVRLPFAYAVPQEWSELIARLKLHGVKVYRLMKDVSAAVTRYHFRDVKFAPTPYEGRQTVTCAYDSYQESRSLPGGTYIIPTDQRTVRIIANALEPKSGDSFLRWGFMNAIFERKEYFEDYVMEKVALEMLRDNPALEKEFNKKLETDTAFRKDPEQRLNFFYERSPYFDKQQNSYPVLRIETPLKNDILKEE